MGVIEDLAAILNARFGKDVRQAIHDAIYDINEVATDAKSSAETSQTSASASAAAALASQQAAAGSAQAAAQSAAQAMSGTPEGYADFVNYCYETGVKNLLPNKAISNEVNGITFTVNTDGSITANGTASAEVLFTIYQFAKTDDINNNLKSYRLSGCPSGGDANTYYLALNSSRRSNSTWYKDWKEYGSGAAFDITDVYYITTINIIVKSGVTLNNIVFKPMITLAIAPNSDYAHYVPYAQSNIALTEKLKNQSANITLNGCDFYSELGTSYLVKNANVVTIALLMKNITVAQWGYIASIPSDCVPPETFFVRTSKSQYQIRPDGKIYSNTALSSDTDIICTTYVCKKQ